MYRHWIAAIAAVFALAGSAEAKIISQSWGVTADDGRPANLYTLSNAAGMEVRISNYGGVLVSLKVPGRDGTLVNVVQGFDSLTDYTSADYLKSNGHYGAMIGRFANRIKGGAVTLEGKTYTLDKDKNGDLDQGGTMAYFRQVFTPQVKDGPEPSLVLKHTDPDGYMGFPGKVNVTVTYTLLNSNSLRIDYRAVSDKPTVINLINHSYFNLAGEGPGTVDDQMMTLFASYYLPVTDGSVPSGEIRSVAGSDFDFLKPTRLGPRLASTDPQMHGHGLDHNFAIDGTPGQLRIAARLEDPKSGRRLEVWTTQPGMQVYSANGVRPQVALAVKHYVPHGAISFQTQHYPDSPNHPNFPSTELRPGQVFHETTEFRFSTAP